MQGERNVSGARRNQLAVSTAVRGPGERSHLAEDARTGDHDLATPTSKLVKNWANAAGEINPIADAIENKSMRFIAGSSDHHPTMRTPKPVGMMPYQTLTSTDKICNIYRLPAKPRPQAAIFANAENRLLALAPRPHAWPTLDGQQSVEVT
jgi:hypothetical protein